MPPTMNSAAPVGDATDRPLGVPVYGGAGAGTLTYPFIPIGTTVLITDTAGGWNVPEKRKRLCRFPGSIG